MTNNQLISSPYVIHHCIVINTVPQYMYVCTYVPIHHNRNNSNIHTMVQRHNVLQGWYYRYVVGLHVCSGTTCMGGCIGLTDNYRVIRVTSP